MPYEHYYLRKYKSYLIIKQNRAEKTKPRRKTKPRVWEEISKGESEKYYGRAGVDMSETERYKLQPGLSPAGAWAFALGTSIGWGSLVVTANTYLAEAGPLGSTLGMVVGAVIMLIISKNYAYMMECYPECGGAYAFSREVFGYDHGFLAAWFLILTYLAMLWANATALPLFARYFLGDMFHIGRMYSLFGYDVYFGEALLSIAAIILVAFLCIHQRKVMSVCMLGMAIFFTAAITICFIAGIAGRGQGLSFTPAYVPENGLPLRQIVRIAAISPWAFIGFEIISHGTEEFTFHKNKSFRVLVTAVVSSTLLYIFVTLLSVTAYPSQYGSWLEYIRDLGSLSGMDGLPAFYAARHYLGSHGVWILILALLCLILTSFIGNITALSRLLFAMGRDKVIPKRFGTLNRHGVPAHAILVVAIVSSVVPFLGRTAIGWIVDVTTLGATLIYGIVSAATMKLAGARKDRLEERCGLVGLVIMVCFGVYLLVPNLFVAGSMAPESYFLFVVWSVLGFIFFRMVLRRDKEKHFGQSIIVWIALLSLILFVSLVWMNQSIMSATNEGLSNIEAYFEQNGIADLHSEIVAQQMMNIRRISARSIIVVVALFATSLVILVNNYALMSRKARESENELGRVWDMANTDPLTGVKSKRAFTEKESHVDGEISGGQAGPFALAVCDVNGLKLVNDTLGHKAGDEMIKNACHMICKLFRHSPVYRIGGDEFAVFLAGQDYENREKLLQTLHEMSVAHISTGEVVVSGGYADFEPGKDTNMHAVFERADARMYTEKKALKAMGAATR